MMASIRPAEPPTEIEAGDIHEVLSNERRQLTIQFLNEEGETMSVRELSERIAAFESGEDPPPRNIRQSAYVALHQVHLPKLDNLNVVEYNDASKTVSLSSSAKRVSSYMDKSSHTTTGEPYIVIAVVGLVLIGVIRAGFPVPNAVNPSWIGLLMLLVTISVATIQVRRGDLSLFRHFR